MDWDEFRIRGKDIVDFMVDYYGRIRDFRVFPRVEVGFLKKLLSDAAPNEGEGFERLWQDFLLHVFPGVTHWNSPNYHAYYPSTSSPPSILGTMLECALNCNCSTWASNPAATELEMIVMDWMGKMIDLPKHFLHSTPNCNGGGTLLTTTSESNFISLIAARTKVLKRMKQATEVLSNLVAYASDQAHSSVEKARIMCLTKVHYIYTDENLSMRGEQLAKAIDNDKKKGLIPFYVCATLGSTGACAFDNLKEIASVAVAENMWLHVDAAYAGVAFVCPEYQKWMEGIEFVDSFALNPSKWMMVNFGCSALWVKDSSYFHKNLNADPVILANKKSEAAVDFLHWQVPFGKKFYALKLWFVLNTFGLKTIQKHIRESVKLCEHFESLVRNDERFEIAANRYLGLVCFRLKGENYKTEDLLKTMNEMGALHCVPSTLHGVYAIRFVITSQHTTLEDVQKDWDLIQKCVSFSATLSESERAALLPDSFKASALSALNLLLCSDIVTPTIIDGSYMTTYANHSWSEDDLRRMLQEFSKGCTLLNPRFRKLVSNPSMLSLDSRLDLLCAFDFDKHGCHTLYSKFK